MKNPFQDKLALESALDALSKTWDESALEILILSTQFSHWFGRLSQVELDFIKFIESNAFKAPTIKLQFALHSLFLDVTFEAKEAYLEKVKFLKLLYSSPAQILTELYGVKNVHSLNQVVGPKFFPIIFQGDNLKKLNELLEHHPNINTYVDDRFERPFCVVTNSKNAHIFYSANCTSASLIHEIAHAEHLMNLEVPSLATPFEKESIALRAEWRFLRSEMEKKSFLHLNYERQKQIFELEEKLFAGEEEEFLQAINKGKINTSDLLTAPFMSAVYCYATLEAIS